ncbi:hypothetical protein [Sphingomonas profundi]|uniref:hypothetical protein n=1 Tax=Alterirhizorhabdus profundi TaxID=2681549 RepID=UPI0012E717FC|nr:hypothetical protein [Sphingomonas profundi]
MAKIIIKDERAVPPASPRGKRLYRDVSGEPPTLYSLSRTTVFLAAVAWTATIGLAFMLGRASVAPLSQTISIAPENAVPDHSGPKALASARPSVQATAPAEMPKHAEIYPRFASVVPTAFRGSWDEIVSDRCAGREARYTLTATTFRNFEVNTDVEKVKVISKNQIELSVTGYDEGNNQFNDKIGFRLLDNGKTLSGDKEDSNLYRKCPP